MPQRWKQHNSPSLDEWISKVGSIRTTEYYLALKTKEILTHATTLKNLQDLMLSEISQPQKVKYYMILLISELTNLET